MGLLNASSRFMMMVMSSIFLAASALLMFIGVKVYIFIGSIKDAVSSSYLSGPGAVMILLSLMCLVIGILGYVGALNKGKGVAAVFLILLVVIFLMELTGIILSCVYKDEVEEMLERQMNTSFQQYGNDTGITNGIDSIQKTFQCCGVENYKDWSNKTYAWNNGSKHDDMVPQTCCKKDEDKCTGSIKTEDDLKMINQDGCQSKLVRSIHGKLVWIIVFVIVFMLVQLTGLVCTCIRLRAKKKVPYQQLGSDAGGQYQYA